MENSRMKSPGGLRPHEVTHNQTQRDIHTHTHTHKVVLKSSGDLIRTGTLAGAKPCKTHDRSQKITIMSYLSFSIPKAKYLLGLQTCH